MTRRRWPVEIGRRNVLRGHVVLGQITRNIHEVRTSGRFALLIVPHAQRLLDASDAEALVTHQIALNHPTHTNPPETGQAPLEANASKAGKAGTKTFFCHRVQRGHRGKMNGKSFRDLLTFM